MAKKKKREVAKKITSEHKEIKKEIEKKEEAVKEVSSKKAEREHRAKKAKKKSFVSALITTILIAIICSVSLYPLFKSTKFGLDLQGGFEILYKVESIDDSKVTSDMINSTYKIINRRIDILGVSEPEISIEGNNIRVQLAGVTDEKEAKNTLSKMANLTFRNGKDELLMGAEVLSSKGVKVIQDPSNVGMYALSLDIADVDTFHEKTETVRKAGDVMVIWLDFEEGVDSYEKQKETCGASTSSHCLSAASISGELTGNSVSLTSRDGFPYEEASTLAELINNGSLPTKLSEISSRTVNASFGEDALEKTFFAGIVGITAIMIVLILVYRFSGFVASVSIVVYTALVFLFFNMIGGRLTLPSIAAVVIGIGMAVDACVISFSRIKEELRNKHTLKESFKKGNKNSLSSILDSNITTFIACIILFIFGESSVKGFATMFIISIIVTLFAMIFIMRLLLGMFVESGVFENRYRAFLGIKSLDEKSIFEKGSFMKWCPRFTLLALVLLIAGGIFFSQKGFNLGIDFKGGSSISLASSSKLEKDQIRKDIEELGYSIDKIDVIDENSVYITVSDMFEASDNEKVEKYFNEKYEETTTSIGAVSNIVKKQLLENAIKSLIYACIGLIIYVSLRFTFTYGISSIVALVHDVLMVIICFSLFRLEVTSIFIAAILSIVGYSINNTIVAFDRARENKKKLYNNKIKKLEELKNLVDVTLKEVVNRSLLTSMTTLLPVIALIFLGSHEIINFNYALLIGLIAGTYSSLFIALYVWYLMEKRRIGKPEKKKWYEVDNKGEIEELKVKGINC